MSDRSRHAGPTIDPFAGTWTESFLSPAEAQVLRRRFGIAGSEADDEAIDLLGRVPPDDEPGGSSAPAAPPMPPQRRADD